MKADSFRCCCANFGTDIDVMSPYQNNNGRLHSPPLDHDGKCQPHEMVPGVSH
jgi:hypothetical protein